MIYPSISIIFPTLNGWQDTLECLKSIKKLNYPKYKLEVIIIDNGSADNTLKTITDFKFTISNLKLIRNKNNLGFAKAVNKGIQSALGDYFLITNNDVLFEKDYLKKLVEFSLTHPLAGIVGGKTYFKSPKNKISFGGAKFDFFTGILLPNKKTNFISETDWIPGCNLLVSRKILEKVGLFDEKFFFYFEDLDLCLRVKKAGYKIYYYPKATMYHGEGASIKREHWQKNASFYYDGKTRVLFKHGTKLQILCALSFQFSLGMLFQLLIMKHQNYSISINALKKYLKTRTHQIPLLPKKVTKQFPTISVVTPSFNNESLIRKFIRSIEKQKYPQDKIEIIVVDNASMDQTAKIIENEFPQVKLIKLKENTGSAPPVGIAGKIAQGEFILSTNDDVVFEKNCFTELVSLAIENPQAGIVTGKMMSMEKNPKGLFFGFKNNWYLGYFPYDFNNKESVRECDWAPGSCIFVRKNLMHKLNYFDNDFIFCGDDYDFCFRVKKLGYKILYNPKAIYYHNFNHAKVPSQNNLFAHYRGKILLMIKNANYFQIITFTFFQFIIAPVCQTLKGKYFILPPLAKGLRWNLKYLKRTVRTRKVTEKQIFEYWQEN